MRRVLKQCDVLAYYKPMNTLCQLLVRPKDKILKERANIYIYIDNLEPQVDMDGDKILVVEPRWLERVVREAIHIRMEQLSLNKDGGRYNLPPVWNNVLRL